MLQNIVLDRFPAERRDRFEPLMPLRGDFHGKMAQSVQNYGTNSVPCRLSIVRDTRQGRRSDSTTFQLHVPTRLMIAWVVPFRGLGCLAGVLTA
jgi:hypothetical protein